MKEKITRELIHFILDTDTRNLNAEIIEAAEKCFLDWIGVTLGGLDEPPARIILDYIKNEGGGGRYSVLGYGFKTSAGNAALVNGTMAHSLDFDDAHMYTRSHLSAPLIAALLPVAEYRKSTGSELIAAFVAGMEAGSRIGLALGNTYYDNGWHSTPVLGRFGAAAGVGKLLGQGEEKMNHALGLAATQAGGIRLSFGTMAKPFHAGKAAMDGVLSSFLSDQGFTGCKDVLDKDKGFGTLLSPDYDPSHILQDLGRSFCLRDISFKPYAACLALHPPITGLLDIMLEHSPDPATIESIHLEVAPICVTLGDHPNPETALEGKFSVHYCSALAVLKGHVGNSLFDNELVRAKDVRRLMEGVGLTQRNDFEESEAKVELVITGGTRLARHVTAPKGDPENPLSLSELHQKAADLTEGILSQKQFSDVVSLIHRLPELENICDLMETCRSERGTFQEKGKSFTIEHRGIRP